jgi:hypothetical protein
VREWGISNTGIQMGESLQKIMSQDLRHWHFLTLPQALHLPLKTLKIYSAFQLV